MNLSRCAAFLIAVVAAALPLHAQLILPDKGETLPAFQVATIKPSSSALGRSFQVSMWWNDNSFRTLNTPLRDLIRTAFNADSPAQLTGGPDALLDARFDVNAKIAEDDYAHMQKLPRGERSRVLGLMMQAFLADRFGLRVHIETRELAIFDLVADKTGAKLQPSAPDPPPAPPASTASAPDPPAAPPKPHQGTTTSIGPHQASMEANDATLATLTTMLARQPELDGRLVLDKTGLIGKYDFKLQWQPQRLDAAPDPDATGPSLFAALKEQLGLKLEPAKAPVPIVVIDAASAPSPN
ncbi:MAG TPA: TIGR03435 family protein [Acidobacteriaceae bacterium]|jgi:uncharacterized protein (TIGR03435 family)|nr:TIGR03435 family protein [Acidobacteriaceae bacterium]